MRQRTTYIIRSGFSASALASALQNAYHARVFTTSDFSQLLQILRLRTHNKTLRHLLFLTSSMDPITVVSFVAAVVQLIGVTSKAVNYLNDVKNAPKDRAKLAREATNLLSLFTELRYRMEEATPTDPWFTGLRLLGGEGGPLMEFKIAMEAIADKLAPATGVGNLRKVLRWTLDKKEIDAILSKIERLKTLVGLALQHDHL